MIIVLTSKGTNRNRVYEVTNEINYSKALDKLNWLLEHIEGLGYMLLKQTSHTFEFFNKKGEWRFGVMLADGWIKKGSLKQ